MNTCFYYQRNMKSSVLLKSAVVPVLLLGLTSLKFASGDDARELRKAFILSCENAVMERKCVDQIYFCDQVYKSFLRSFQGFDPVHLQMTRLQGYFEEYLQDALFTPRIPNNQPKIKRINSDKQQLVGGLNPSEKYERQLG